MLCEGFVGDFCVFSLYVHGVLLGFADRPPLVAMCVVFVWPSCVFDAMCMVFVAWFRRQATIGCYIRGFFLCVFDAMCMGFSIGSAHRPAFVQISTYSRNS